MVCYLLKACNHTTHFLPFCRSYTSLQGRLKLNLNLLVQLSRLNFVVKNSQFQFHVLLLGKTWFCILSHHRSHQHVVTVVHHNFQMKTATNTSCMWRTMAQIHVTSKNRRIDILDFNLISKIFQIFPTASMFIFQKECTCHRKQEWLKSMY